MGVGEGKLSGSLSSDKKMDTWNRHECAKGSVGERQIQSKKNHVCFAYPNGLLGTEGNKKKTGKLYHEGQDEGRAGVEAQKKKWLGYINVWGDRMGLQKEKPK